MLSQAEHFDCLIRINRELISKVGGEIASSKGNSGVEARGEGQSGLAEAKGDDPMWED